MEAIFLITSGLVSVIIGVFALNNMRKTAKQERQGLRSVTTDTGPSVSSGPY
jgi:hypothetical protein